jgi:hypothetical protein
MDDGEPRSATPLTWIAAAFAAAACASAASVGADARWLAAVGEAIVRFGRLPHSIGYAAAPSSWHDAPALGQLVFHVLVRAFGDRGLVGAQFAAVTCALTAIAIDVRRTGARDGAGALVILGVVVGVPATVFVVRAELFSLALFPLLLLLLRREAGWRTQRIWLAVPLLALWANLHGGVLVGFGVLAAYLVLDRARYAPLESLGVLASSAVALLATPALLHSVTYYANVLSGETAVEHYGLWAHLDPSQPLDLVFCLVAIPMLAAALRTRPRLWECALLVTFALMTVNATRNGIWLLLFAAPHAARSLGARRMSGGMVGRRVTLACLAVLAAIAVTSFRHAPAEDGASPALLDRAVAAANGSPILAEPIPSEQLALRGARIWIGNPLDAFPNVEQRRYLDWVRGDPAGASLLRRVRVAVVLRGTAAQRQLARDGAYRELARDERAIAYLATA